MFFTISSVGTLEHPNGMMPNTPMGSTGIKKANVFDGPHGNAITMLELYLRLLNERCEDYGV